MAIRFALSLALFLFVNASFCMEIAVPVDNFPPWKIARENNKIFGGIDLQLLRVVIDSYNEKYSTSHTLKFYQSPWIRSLKMMENGNADMLNGVLDKAERRKYLHYLTPAYKDSSTKAFYYLGNGDTKVDKYEDLYKYSIGVVNGTSYFERFDNDKRLNKRSVVDHKQLVYMLQKKRFNVIVGTESQMDYILSKEIRTRRVKKLNYKFDKKIKVYFTVSKKSKLAKHVERLNSVVRELKAMGVFKKIIDGYFLALTSID